MPPSPAPGRALRRRRPPESAARSARWAVGLVLLALVALVTALLTAFDSNGPAGLPTAAPAPAQRLLPAGPPRPQVVAVRGSLRIQLPVSQQRLTAIGYHAAGDGALALQPLGHRANQGFFGRLVHRVFGGGRDRLRYYQLAGGAGDPTGALDVGAAAGTDVYSPVDGTVVGITDEVLNGKRHGASVDLQPSGAPSVVVSLTHLRPDQGLTVGDPVAAASSKIGTVLSFAGIEHQALARYTQDDGNHVSLELHSASPLSIP